MQACGLDARDLSLEMSITDPRWMAAKKSYQSSGATVPDAKEADSTSATRLYKQRRGRVLIFRYYRYLAEAATGRDDGIPRCSRFKETRIALLARSRRDFAAAFEMPAAAAISSILASRSN